MLLNQIYSYSFEDMLGNIPRNHEELEMFIRPGINGVGARRTGFRTKPTEVLTFRYTDDFQSAYILTQNYQSLIGRNPVQVIQYDEPLGNYIIQDVVQDRAEAVTTVAGSIIQPPRVPTVLLVCRWTIWG